MMAKSYWVVAPSARFGKMEIIKGYVQSVVFHNDSNGYAIVRVKIDQKKDERVIVVGYFNIPRKEELCAFKGDFVDHPRFGRQFKVEAIEKIMPNSDEAVLRYLSSSLFRGVGVKCAEKIIETLGPDCLQIIKDTPERINEVNIKPELREVIVKGIGASTRLDEAIKLFVGHGIPMKYLIKMDAVYGKDLIPIVLSNPYILIRDIDGIGFRMADKIARSLGITELDERRIDALLIYSIKQICFKTQDTYTSKNTIYRYALGEADNLSYDSFEDSFNHLIAINELIDEDGKIYYSDLYNAEKGIAEYLKKYIKMPSRNIPLEVIDQEIDKVEKMTGIKYSLGQREAIISCMNNGISIITGGPGTGKTTVVDAILKIYEDFYPEDDIYLCAPTGRAGKRMSELTGKEATTIHRLLKWDLDSNRFSIDMNNPIHGDFLIVDEFSMVDCQLFYHLLDGTYPFRKLLLIGDDKQLPPVSPGDALRDLLAVNLIPTSELNEIHRQDKDSGIIPLCYDVRKGMLDKKNLDCYDVKFYPCSSIEVKDLVLDLIKQAQEEGMNEEDIQVLSPMYDGGAGITNLNAWLRDYFNPANPSKMEVRIGTTTYRVGDKILQLKNQPADNIYNGDIGWLEEIIDTGSGIKLLINFDDNIVEYTNGDFVNITHAYCISVHKSQGSEYPYVIFTCFPEQRIMLKRKLIYTAISRAKKQLAIIGNYHNFEEGIRVIERSVRKTSLKERLLEVLK